MKKALLFFLIAGKFLFAQIGSPAEDSKNFLSPRFFLEALANKSSIEGKSRLDVYIQVPFNNLQFVKKENLFTASYSVTLTVYNENKETVIYDQNWIEKVQSEKFEDTDSPYSSNFSLRSVDLSPGKYVLFCSVEDADSKKMIFNEAPLNVKGFADSLDMSDALLIQEIIKAGNTEQMIPNVSRIVTTNVADMPVYFEVYSGAPQAYTFDYTLKNGNDSLFYSQSEEHNLTAGVNKILYTFKNMKLILGEIKLGILIKKNGVPVKNYIKIISGRIRGLPVTVTNIDDAASQMAYIASDGIIKSIKEAPTEEEKLKKFFEFWDKKKISPAAEDNPMMTEYYRRVEYSINHFRGKPAGWRSDMGMVYIILGPPDMVERQPMPANSRPYEIWNYNRLNKRYVFLDQTGFGSYILQNPDYDLLNGAGEY